MKKHEFIVMVVLLVLISACAPQPTEEPTNYQPTTYQYQYDPVSMFDGCVTGESRGMILLGAWDLVTFNEIAEIGACSTEMVKEYIARESAEGWRIVQFEWIEIPGQPVVLDYVFLWEKATE